MNRFEFYSSKIEIFKFFEITVKLPSTKFSDSIKLLYIKTLDISTCIYEDIINSKTLLSAKNHFKKTISHYLIN